jgi:hypothetical protein
MPLAEAAEREFPADETGDGGEDFSAAVRHMEQLAAVEKPEFPSVA